MFRSIIAIFFMIFIGTDFISMSHPASEKRDEDKIKLTTADQKKLEKADKETQKSIQLKQQADKMYSDNAAKQADLSAEESEKLNNKALEKQIEALKIQKSANETRYNVYAAKIEEFWKKYKGDPDELIDAKTSENSGKLNYQSAQDQFKEVDENKDKLITYSKMSSASDLLTKAVENTKKAFEIYSNTSLSASAKSLPRERPNEKQTDTIKTNDKQIPANEAGKAQTEKEAIPSSDIYHAVNVGESMVEKFNIFLKEYSPDYKRYIYNFSSLTNSDIDSVRIAWERYLQREKNTNNLPGNNSKQSTQINESPNKNVNSKSEAVANSNLKTTQGNSRKTLNKQKAVSSYKKTFPDTFFEKGFTYKVQIVACRVPMNNEYLKEIYTGPEQLEEINENEWYKYSIGQFNSYESASQFRDKCGVKSAFVVAYLNGKKIRFKDGFR